MLGLLGASAVFALLGRVAADLDVYVDGSGALSSGWQDWSWSSVVSILPYPITHQYCLTQVPSTDQLCLNDCRDVDVYLGSVRRIRSRVFVLLGRPSYHHPICWSQIRYSGRRSQFSSDLLFVNRKRGLVCQYSDVDHCPLCELDCLDFSPHQLFQPTW